MYDSKEANGRRIMAGIMSLLMLMIVLFSAFFIAAETHHDCCGEDCQICACIQQCEKTLCGIGDGAVTQAAFIAPVILSLLAAVFSLTTVVQGTLVSRKVRLNN